MRTHTVQEWLRAGGRIVHIHERPIHEAVLQIKEILKNLNVSKSRVRELFSTFPVSQANEMFQAFTLDEAIRTARNYSPDRVITVAFFEHPTTQAIYYGASVFSYDQYEPCFDKYIRRQNNQQAVDRACNNPIIVKSIFTTEDVKDFVMATEWRYQAKDLLRQYLRDCVRSQGVQDSNYVTGDSGYDTMQEMLRLKGYHE